MKTAGIHHITAFAANVQDNVDFYAGVLGLRLVKQTVNFDAPEVYHLYFGNENGSPGTAITFFPFKGARRGRIGGGQVGWTTFVVPPGTLPFWEQRLNKFGISFSREQRFGETYLRFRDHEGMQLELVEREEGPQSRWSFGGIAAEQAIKGFGGAVLFSTDPERTIQVLQDVLGMEKIGAEGGLVRFRAAGERGNWIDVNEKPQARGWGGSGTVHHIAWRARDDEEHQEWREQVIRHGFQATPIVDRNYFKALYFREEGGILFEIATDPPGFERDEPFDALGGKLLLPEWLEPHRLRIEQGLQPFKVRVLEADIHETSV